MNELKDENLCKSVQSSSDFTDNPPITTLCLLPLYSPIYFVLICFFSFWDGNQNFIPDVWQYSEHNNICALPVIKASAP